MNRRSKKRLDPNTVVLLKQIGIGMLVIGIVALLVTGVWYGTRVEALTITEIEAKGGETIKSEDVIALAEPVLEGEYVGLIPKRFAWFYPKQAMIEAVSETPRIYNIEIERANGRTLQITYDEYVPHALWCAETGDDMCLFMDSSAYAFATAPQLSGGSFLRFIKSGATLAVGESVFTQEEYESMLELVRLLGEQGWFISHVEMDQVGDAFLRVVGGGELKITVADEPQQVVENLLVILAAEEFSDVAPGNFNYIDLRFGNKVFVNEELAAPEMDTASGTASSTGLSETELGEPL
jgi:hypothetical protein